MDIDLIRTFLEIVSTHSFIRAAERLNVSQTTVSARVKTLEDRLGRPLFIRNKSGASLTPAGEQFLRYAPTFVQLWERARHQVAVPSGHRAVLAIGGELALWHPLMLDWLLWMRENASDIALRVQVGLPEGLVSQVAEGVLDIAVLYAPQHRPGLKVEKLLEETLVLVTTDPEMQSLSSPDYVYVDWGPNFAFHHGLSFPDVSNPGLFVGLGPLALNYVVKAGGSGYFRMGAAKPHLEAGRLHLVKGAPSFSYPIYAIFSAEADKALINQALDGVRRVAVHSAV
ncbi:MAG TPA: LysR family transcriptional regulator [Xanthobacteraceae bacterium]|nr:LysR family transcriptional regulator [Xanthobacteraceae bacterium]